MHGLLYFSNSTVHFGTTDVNAGVIHTPSHQANWARRMRCHRLWKYFALCVLLVSSSLHAEDYDVDADTGFRMERYRAPVPESVPGGITINTEFMQQAMANKTLKLIDVYPPKGLGPDPLSGEWLTPEIRESIPSAVWLPDVGRGFLEPELEDYFRRNLAAITNNDFKTPIVFFCTSDCWQSWNASVRAYQWGYTQVHWYPTGSDGWKEEGGEVVIVPPVNFLETIEISAPQSQANNVFPNRARVLLSDNDGNAIDIGEVTFTAASDGQYAITVNVESDKLNNHFLSMRPFQCLDGAAEWFCYQPYPYELKQVVSETDLTDLEYQLLFIRKTPKEFGIDAWNGLYFKFSQHDDGIWRGQLLEGDLNVLQSPPEKYSRPINLSEFIEADTALRRFTEITLQPN